MLALVVAAVTAFLALWIVVPAPNRLLLPLAVGAPEVSAWLIVAGIVAILLALSDVGARATARLALVLAIVALTLAASPFFRFATVAASAERSLETALGSGYASRIPAAQKARFTSSPLSLAVLARGFGNHADAVQITRGIEVARHDDVTLTMDVYQPREPGAHPVLVQVYGGAWQRGEPGDFSEFATYIAAQGYVVFAVDYRHAPRFTFPTQLDDLREALRLIRDRATEWGGDVTRLALMGRSAGAHLAMLAAYAPDAPPIRGVIDYYGPVDLIEGYRRPPVPDPLRVREIEEAFLGGPPDAMPARYLAASPISLVTRQLPPTLLVYGGRDHIVEARFGSMLADSLRREGGTVVHVEIPWAEHAFDTVPNGPSGQLARYVTERFLAAVMRR
ncbi:MAG: alpha/beta hydrolase [Gemmatimonadota bacterium]